MLIACPPLGECRSGVKGKDLDFPGNIYSVLKVFLPISTSFVSFCGGAIITGNTEKPS